MHSNQNGHVNFGYQNSENVETNRQDIEIGFEETNKEEITLRDQWKNKWEFLMSCIAMSVGLGNIWRFPITAYENGGGAFIIPYIIVVIFIGRPLYYMEMIIGQFSSRGNVVVYANMCPFFTGLGYGQVFATFCVMSYYSSLVAISMFYLLRSFQSTLPWSKCNLSWGDICYDTDPQGVHLNSTRRIASTHLYFQKSVLSEMPNIDDGIGIPNWYLVGCLFLVWCAVFIVTIKGIKSSGKASYFLALSPYAVLITLFIRAITLPGATEGIKYFLVPQWQRILQPKVWYAAVTQAFFSLNISYGTITMLASFNKFDHNVKRDATVIICVDTFTSLLAGMAIFGILGNLVYETGTTIEEVAHGGAGLAFVSFPNAISKFQFIPQMFAVLFFLMLLILGVGCLVAYLNNVIIAVYDSFKNVKLWLISLTLCTVLFLVGNVYLTPGGQFILNLVDYFGVMFVIFILSIVEMIVVFWIYGTNNFCQDVEFMLKIKISMFWKFCWGTLSPLLLIIILIYFLCEMKPITYKNLEYPLTGKVCGWILWAVGISPLLACAIYYSLKSFFKKEKILKYFKPTSKWGPADPKTRQKWIDYKTIIEQNAFIDDQIYLSN